MDKKEIDIKIFAENIEESAMENLKEMCKREMLVGSKIRIMPDVHAGKGCTIGTTLTVDDKVDPRYVGVDLGCGVTGIPIAIEHINYGALDRFIRNNIPSGKSVNCRPTEYSLLENLNCKEYVNVERAKLSLGTLGGGNHYLELAQGEFTGKWLMVHSGSRQLGKQIADYYINYANEKAKTDVAQECINKVQELKASGREAEICKALQEIKKHKDYNILTGELLNEYLYDLSVATYFAMKNRELMLKKIVEFLGGNFDNLSKYKIDTKHNYISGDSILRKGAISAIHSEKLLIPISMKEGTILGLGKGNADWNYSAPHGAGRLLSRGQARKSLSLDEFKDDMKGVWTSCVSENTLDEAPQAYKSLDYILGKIEPTVKVVDILTPLYNFKA